jgi:hypothetical protein
MGSLFGDTYTEIKQLKKQIEDMKLSIDFQACLTGDCSHETQEECVRDAVQNTVIAEQQLTEALKNATTPLATGGSFTPVDPKAVKTAMLLAADAGGTFLAMYQRKVGDLEEKIKKMSTVLLEIEIAAMLICGSPASNIDGMKATANLIVEKIDGVGKK